MSIEGKSLIGSIRVFQSYRGTLGQKHNLPYPLAIITIVKSVFEREPVQ